MTRDQLYAEHEKREKEMRDKISKFYLSDTWKNVRNCPFCGNGKKSLFMVSDDFGSAFWIACETSDFGCGATGPVAATPEEAAKLWNGVREMCYTANGLTAIMECNRCHEIREIDDGGIPCDPQHPYYDKWICDKCLDEIQSEEVSKDAADQTT